MKLIPKAISKVAARSFLQSQKHSPEALLIAGIAGMGATVFLACRATLHVEEVLVRHEEKLSIREVPEPSVRDKVDLAVNISKLYAPAILSGAFSVSLLVGGNKILNRRNAALAAAYGTLEKAFDGYRERVAEAYGRDREQEIYHDVRQVEAENPETGRMRKTKEAFGGSPYSFRFDQGNRNWDSSLPTMNYQFLKYQEAFATQRLNARGHIFLNEVLDSVGMDRVPHGQVTGWIKGEGDAFVDFGITSDGEEVIEFMAGRSGIMLDFNCSGTIFDKI